MNVYIFFLLAQILNTKNINYYQKKIDNRYKLIQGTWADKRYGNAIFSIQGRAITFFEHQSKSRRYTIKNDTLIINIDKISIKYVITKLNNDSLIIVNELNIKSRLYKRTLHN